MGRPPKYKKGPIFLLRDLIGGEKPITQTELERWIDIPFATIQAAESAREGERTLSQAMRHNIRLYTGCIWEPVKRFWQFDRWLVGKVNPGEDRFVTATTTLVAQYRDIFSNSSLSDEERLEDAEAFKGWMEELCKRMPSKDWARFSTRFSEFTEGCCRDFRLGDPTEFFDTAMKNSEDIRLAFAQHWDMQKIRDQVRKAAIAFNPDSEEGKKSFELRDAVVDVVKMLRPKAGKRRGQPK